MTTYARIIRLSTDTKWIAVSNALRWLKNHPDVEVSSAGEQLDRLLNEQTELVQMSGGSIDENGQQKIWISE